MGNDKYANGYADVVKSIDNTPNLINYIIGALFNISAVC
jgi:hypothetical protein